MAEMFLNTFIVSNWWKVYNFHYIAVGSKSQFATPITQFGLFIAFLQRNNFNHLHEEERAGCLLLLSFGCLVTVNVMWLFLTAP